MDAQRVKQLRLLHRLQVTLRRQRDELEVLIKEGEEMGFEIELSEVVLIMTEGEPLPVPVELPKGEEDA